jgi:hypothetical protein
MQVFEVMRAEWAGVGHAEHDLGKPADHRPCFVGGVSPVLLGTPVRICYKIPRPEHVSLSIHSVDGRHVATLVDAAQTQGAHQVEWDGCDKYGNIVSPGTYFCSLKTGGSMVAKKLIVVQ